MVEKIYYLKLCHGAHVEQIGTARENTSQSRLESEREKMVREMGVTKGCRFNASKRLQNAEKRRTITIAGASIFVIVLSLLPVMFPVPELLNNFLTLLAVGFSIIILVASTLQASDSDAVKADQLHRCSLEINAIRYELRAAEPLDESTLKSYGKRYQDILQRYTVNHDDVDFEKYKLEHQDLYPLMSTTEKTQLKKDVMRSDYLSEVARVFALLAGAATAAAVVYEPLWEPAKEFVKRLVGP